MSNAQKSNFGHIRGHCLRNTVARVLDTTAYAAKHEGILASMGVFSDRVFAVVRQVPAGKVATYGLVARLMGRPQSARYVGFALRNNPSPTVEGGEIPCHRVVFKDGSLCEGFAFGGPDVQRELLEAEGVTFADDTHVDLAACLWNGEGAFSPAVENVLPQDPAVVPNGCI